MSQLHPKSSSIGVIPTAVDWSSFVNFAIDLTIKAYWKMRAERVVTTDFEEDAFTINLVKWLQKVGYEESLNIQIQTQYHVYTNEMHQGVISTNQAKKIDIYLAPELQNKDQIYFSWEAKRLGGTAKIADYVNDGMYCYINKDYSAFVNDAGMLGYVLSDNAEVYVEKINRSMGHISKNPPLNSAHHLKHHPLGHFSNCYVSSHLRVDSDPINLYHLFLEFDFEL